MQVNSRKSREAHTETLGSVAALRIVQPRCSVAPGANRAIPSQHPVQGADADQPFNFTRAPNGVVGRPLRPHRLANSVAANQTAVGHDHPTARLLVNLIGFGTLLIGLAIWFA